MLGVIDDSFDDFLAGLGDTAGVERRLRVVFDHELAGLGGGLVEQDLDQPQCHVDAARYAGRRDDPLIEMLNHTFASRQRPEPSKLVERAPVRGCGQSVEQPGGGEHKRACANRRGETGTRMSSANPVEYLGVGHE